MPIRKTSVTGKAYVSTEYYSRTGNNRYPPLNVGVNGAKLQVGSNYNSYSWDSTRDVLNNSFTSVSTPGYYVKKKVLVQWIPKKYPLKPPHALKSLRLPTIRPYKGLKLSPLIVSNIPDRLKTAESRASFVKRRDAFLAKATKQRELKLGRHRKRYDLYYARITSIRAQLLINFKNRKEKYDRRMKRFNELVKRQANGVHRMRRVKSTEAHLVRNPYTRTMQMDLGTSGFRVEIITSSLDNVFVQAKGPYMYYKGVTIYNSIKYDDFFGAPPAFPFTMAATNADNKAVGRLYKEISAQEVHIGNLIAERAQTLGLITTIIKKIIAFKRNPLSFVKDYAGALPKNVSDDTLAFLFGVKPLLNDVYSSVKALERLTDLQQKDSEIIRVGGTDTKHVETVTHYYGQTGGILRTHTLRMTETVKVNYTLEYKIVNGALAGLQRMGLLNPAEVLWEAMPWSFIVDWLWPIGSYINSLSSGAGLQWSGGTRTITTRRTYQSKMEYFPSVRENNGSQFWNGIVNGSKMTETKTRTVLTSAPSPYFPKLKNPFSYLHFTEALALLVQRLKPTS